MSDAVMVLQFDVTHDMAGHDDWHTWEHMHERLSIPGFLRGTRWLRVGEGVRYLVTYEIDNVAIAESAAYLARLNEPTIWTTATMKRLRGMVRGFCRVSAGSGYGLGRAAFALQYLGASASSHAWLAREAEAIATWRGVACAYLLDPSVEPPMTREQAIRGKDSSLYPMLLVTGYDIAALRRACRQHLADEYLRREGIEVVDAGFFELDYTATAAEVSRTPKPRVLGPGEHERETVRLPGYL